MIDFEKVSYKDAFCQISCLYFGVIYSTNIIYAAFLQFKKESKIIIKKCSSKFIIKAYLLLLLCSVRITHTKLGLGLLH